MAKQEIRSDITSRETLDTLSKEELIDVVLHLGDKLQQLSDTVRELVMAKYGRKTERFDDPGQLKLFSRDEPPADNLKESAQEPSDSSIGSRKDTRKAPKKKGHARNAFPDHLPRRPVFPWEAERKCECCNTAFTLVRQFPQRTLYQFVPACFCLEDLIGQVFKCPNSHGDEAVVRVPETVENGIAAPGLMAQVAVAKGTDHLPY